MCGKGILVFSLINLLWASGAEARCHGIGTAWHCRAGTTSAEISRALRKAPDGATLTFAAGSYSWNSFVSFHNSKGVTLACATVGACDVTATGTVLGMDGNLSGINNNLYRISGFNFTGGGTIIWFYGPGIMQQLRIDNNNFNAADGDTVMNFGPGDNSSIASFYGVIDHNNFSSPGSISAFQYRGALNPTPPPSPAGTANNLFFEDNTITITTMTNADRTCMDGWGGNNTVYRHNTSTNCVVASHGATHGGGPANIEFYENNIIVDSGADPNNWDCYRCFHHQGSGEFYAYNNSFTAYSGKNTDVIGMMDYRAYVNSIDGGAQICDGTYTGTFGDGGQDGNRDPITTYAGYPCWHQPGRDFSGNLRPMYIWNNVWSDTVEMVPMVMEDLGNFDGGPDYVPQHEQNNRDYFNAVSAAAQTSPTSPFDGTSGMGFGTLANRPTTCSNNPTPLAGGTSTTPAEDGGGVGYFAIDDGPQGTLYRCSATDTWTVHYVPYVYPHPLVRHRRRLP